MFNRTFWDRFAGKYDAFMKYFSPEYPELIQRISRNVEGAQRILEVGTGTGLIALALDGAGQKIDALDISPVMITRAREKGCALGLDSIRFVIGSAYRLPWPDESYDVVVCANTLHVLEEPGRVVSEMRRVLKCGGELIVPTYCHGEGQRARMASRFLQLFGFKVYTPFTATELQALLEGYGFSMVTAENTGGVIPLYYVVALRV